MRFQAKRRAPAILAVLVANSREKVGRFLLEYGFYRWERT